MGRGRVLGHSSEKGKHYGKPKEGAIGEEKPLTMWKGLRRFLGLTNNHQKFIKGYSTIAQPLHELIKDIKYVWGNDCQKVFESLKEALVTAPVLALPQTTANTDWKQTPQMLQQGRSSIRNNQTVFSNP
jgi:hypothetical protein